MVERRQFGVQRRLVFAQFDRTVEEHLRRHCEELGRVGARVLPQHRRALGADRVVRGRADLHPAPSSVLVAERRCAVGDSVEHVELVRELVVHHVLAGSGEAGTASCGVPREDHRALVVGLTGEQLRPGRSQPAPGGMVAVQAHRGGVHDHGGELRVLVDVEPQQQHRRLGGDQHLDRVVEHEPVGRLPPRPADEPGDEQLHPVEFVGGE